MDMTDFEGIGSKMDHEKEDLPVENLEVSELEDGDLDEVSGGSPVIEKNTCPITNNNC
jgi:hypothetical protein